MQCRELDIFGNFLRNWLEIFWEIFWEFFWRIFLEEFFWRNFWKKFLGRIFWGGFFGEKFFGRNSLFTLLKLFEYGRTEGIDLFVKILVFVKILSKWRRKKEESLEVRGQAHRT